MRPLSFSSALCLLLALPAAPALADAPALYRDASQPVEARIEDLLARMTLEEKVGQMTLIERASVQKPEDVAQYQLGALLSGAGDAPQPNVPESWYAMVENFQRQALTTRLAIPLLYAVDAVHGHSYMKDTTVFPHNIGLGAADNPALTEAIARATAEEMQAAGIHWNFAPALSMAQDVRWGRTYESFSEDSDRVRRHAAAALRGLQQLRPSDTPAGSQKLFTLGTPKHFIADGATVWGSARLGNFRLDRGDSRDAEELMRRRDLPAYRDAVNAGALSIMASFSSWHGLPMHGNPLLTSLLKDELGFTGFVVSDWQGINPVNYGNYRAAVVQSVNAGLDMVMVPDKYALFIDTLLAAVRDGEVSQARIDDAVRRILRAKFALGLFERPLPGRDWQRRVRAAEHRLLARQAVQQSMVLLKNDGQLLPLAEDLPLLRVAGQGADDIGLQSGGWTIKWQGQPGDITLGTTILDGLRRVLGPQRIQYAADGHFSGPRKAAVGLVVLAEPPYAEGIGDLEDIRLTADEIALLQRMRAHSEKLVVVLLSGRPRVITEQLPLADAWVAAWLPGSEASASADVLTGRVPFRGTLPFSWPRSLAQLPINTYNSSGKTGCDAPLFPLGHGLRAGQQWLAVGECR